MVREILNTKKSGGGGGGGGGSQVNYVFAFGWLC